MQHAGAVLQAAIFKTIEADADLLVRFSISGAEDMAPQFSYDGMQSQWRDRAAGVTAHNVAFSVWGPQAGFADADALCRRLIRRLPTMRLPAPIALMVFELQDMDSGFDAASRQWRQRLVFRVLTALEEVT